MNSNGKFSVWNFIKSNLTILIDNAPKMYFLCHFLGQKKQNLAIRIIIYFFVDK